MDSVDGARFVQSDSDQIVSNPCDSCKYHMNEEEASNFCKTCQEKLCKSCTGWHKGFKATRNHKVIPLRDRKIDGKPTIIVTCVCDQNLEAVFYCEWHTDVICKACKNLKHKACETVTVKEKSTGYIKSKLKSVLQRAESLNKRTADIIRKRQPELDQLLAVKEGCKVQIQSFQAELKHILDNLQGDATDRLEQTVTRHKENLECQLSTCETTTDILRSEIELLKDVMETNEKEIQFAADVKVSNRLSQLDSSLEDIFSAIKSANITFKRNTNLIEKLKKTGLGTLAVESSIARHESVRFLELGNQESFDPYRQRRKLTKSFLKLKSESTNHVEIKRSGQKKVPNITGCAFMPQGNAVLCDRSNYEVIILSSNFSYRDSLKLTTDPFDVSVLDKSTIIVTCPGSKQLKYISVTPICQLTIGKTVQLDKKCWGIEIANNEIYVTCHNEKLVGKRDGEIRIFGQNGNLKHTLGVNSDGSYVFCWPFYVIVNPLSRKIFVSDQWTEKIKCLHLSESYDRHHMSRTVIGSVSASSTNNVYEYSAKDLGSLRGVSVDENDNIVVCGRTTDNVKVITASGLLHCTLLTNRDGIKYPQSIAYRKSDNMLMVGCGDSNYLYTKSLDM